MTRRSSLRAQAREIYRDLAARKATETTSLPNPPPQGGREQKEAAGEKNLTAQSLTQKVRALYEDSAVPVAEIAAVAGVTERTVYKYARKGGWQPRYAWIDRGGVNRRRGRVLMKRAGQGFAPAKGAGGRFIRRADKGKPFARGLKATDPAGAARAFERCGEAALLSRQAQRETEAERRSQALNDAIELNNTALRNLREFHERRNKERPGPLDDRLEGILMRIAEMALARCQALVAEEEGAQHALRAPDAAQHEVVRR